MRHGARQWVPPPAGVLRRRRSRPAPRRRACRRRSARAGRWRSGPPRSRRRGFPASSGAVRRDPRRLPWPPRRPARQATRCRARLRFAATACHSGRTARRRGFPAPAMRCGRAGVARPRRTMSRRRMRAPRGFAAGGQASSGPSRPHSPRLAWCCALHRRDGRSHRSRRARRNRRSPALPNPR